MSVVLVFLLVALTVGAVAAVCNGIFAPRLKAGRVSRGRASAVTLLALLIAPAVAAILATGLTATRVTAVYGPTLYFYGGYSVGLVCFIVLNRRFRQLSG